MFWVWVVYSVLVCFGLSRSMRRICFGVDCLDSFGVPLHSWVQGWGAPADFDYVALIQYKGFSLGMIWSGVYFGLVPDRFSWFALWGLHLK